MLRKMAPSRGLILSVFCITTPLAVQAQLADKIYRVGYLGNVAPVASAMPGPSVFLEALRERGYIR